MPTTLRFWVLSDTAPSTEGATFTRMSTAHEVLWINQNRRVATTHESGAQNRLRLPRLTFVDSRVRIAEQVLGLISNLITFSSNPRAQDGTVYVVQHSPPTYARHPTTDTVTLTCHLTLAFSLMELTPHFNGTEVTMPEWAIPDYFNKLMPPIAESYNGPRPTRFERILKEG